MPRTPFALGAALVALALTPLTAHGEDQPAATSAETTAPAPAPARPVKPAEYVELDMVSVDDGHTLDYLDHLATVWRKAEDHAVQQGWILGYEILSNVHKRPGEPDLYLVTRFASLPDAAEQQRREDAFEAAMQQTAASLETQSGERAKYRHLLGSILLQRLIWAH